MPIVWVAILLGTISLFASITIARLVYIGTIKNVKYRNWMVALAATNVIFLAASTVDLIIQDVRITRDCKFFAAFIAYFVVAMISNEILDTFQVLSNNPAPMRILAGKVIIMIGLVIGVCCQLANVAIRTPFTSRAVKSINPGQHNANYLYGRSPQSILLDVVLIVVSYIPSFEDKERY